MVLKEDKTVGEDGKESGANQGFWKPRSALEGRIAWV